MGTTFEPHYTTREKPYPNLMAELRRWRIPVIRLADITGRDRETTRRHIVGTSTLSVEEAISMAEYINQIRRKGGENHLSIEWLFRRHE